MRRSHNGPRGRGRRERRLFSLLLLLAFVLGGPASPARAQAPGGVQPDVQVIVMPLPGGDSAISVVYPKVVGKAAMQAHVRRLLDVSGWKARGAVEYESRGIRYNNGVRRDQPGPAGPPMSSATFATGSPVVDWREATLPVEPWARAFRDLSRVYVTYFVPDPFPDRFRGLRRHSDTNLDVALSEQRGAYTYLLTIKNHELDQLALPRFQVRPEPESVRVADADRRRRLAGMGLVILLAVGAGLLVYTWTHRWSGR